MASYKLPAPSNLKMDYKIPQTHSTRFTKSKYTRSSLSALHYEENCEISYVRIKGTIRAVSYTHLTLPTILLV